jgi:hypothetical protein
MLAAKDIVFGRHCESRVERHLLSSGELSCLVVAPDVIAILEK